MSQAVQLVTVWHDVCGAVAVRQWIMARLPLLPPISSDILGSWQSQSWQWGDTVGLSCDSLSQNSFWEAASGLQSSLSPSLPLFPQSKLEKARPAASCRQPCSRLMWFLCCWSYLRFTRSTFEWCCCLTFMPMQNYSLGRSWKTSYCHRLRTGK